MSSKPPYHQHDEFITRIHKLEEITQLGLNPYPVNYSPEHEANRLQVEYQDQPVGTAKMLHIVQPH